MGLVPPGTPAKPGDLYVNSWPAVDYSIFLYMGYGAYLRYSFIPWFPLTEAF